MTNHSRRRQQHTSPKSENTLLETLEQELSELYMEVEISGLTLGRLLATYGILARNAWAQTTEGLRSLRRPTPAL